MATDPSRPAPGEEFWIDLPDARERAKATAPNAEVRRHTLQMIEKGYALVRGSVSEDDCDRAVASFRRWSLDAKDYAGPYLDDHGHYPRLQNFHASSPEVERIFCANERALAVQDFCFGHPTCAYSSLFFSVGSAQPIHRDLPYFWTVPRHFYFGMWVALEDVDYQNGPLMARPGGHAIEPVDPHAISAAHHPPGEPITSTPNHLWSAYQEEVIARCDAAELPTELIVARKGDAVIWHPLLPHGGLPRSEPHRSRFSIVFHTTPVHVPVYQGDVSFDPSAAPPDTAPWSYREAGGRFIAEIGEPFFGDRNYY